MECQPAAVLLAWCFVISNPLLWKRINFTLLLVCVGLMFLKTADKVTQPEVFFVSPPPPLFSFSFEEGITFLNDILLIAAAYQAPVLSHIS